jgi:hypothetical protein
MHRSDEPLPAHGRIGQQEASAASPPDATFATNPALSP